MPHSVISEKCPSQAALTRQMYAHPVRAPLRHDHREGALVDGRRVVGGEAKGVRGDRTELATVHAV